MDNESNYQLSIIHYPLIMKVLICAGGTGGHIYPALAAVTSLQEMGVQTSDLLWIGTTGKIEEELVPRAGLRLETLAGGAVVSSVPFHKKVLNGLKLIWGIKTAVFHINTFNPDVMFMTGGYTAVSVTIAAWLRRVPVVTYLPDIEPGSTIKMMMRFTDKVACTSPSSDQFLPREKMVVTGYPVRDEVRAAVNMSKADALAQFNLTTERKTLFVFGGSRGALNINTALMDNLPALLEKIQIIHISGTLTWPQVEENAAKLPEHLRAHYRPYPYLHEEMGAAFRAADLTMARSGASMLGECPAFGLPSILVPLTFAWRYQKVNADYLTERGASIQSTDETLADDLPSIVLDLLTDEARLQQMSQAAAAMNEPNAAMNLAELITIVGRSTNSRRKEGANV